MSAPLTGGRPAAHPSAAGSPPLGRGARIGVSRRRWLVVFARIRASDRRDCLPVVGDHLAAGQDLAADGIVVAGDSRDGGAVALCLSAIIVVA